MKKLVLLMICLLIACLNFSQTLKPTIHIQDKDTLFCFDLSQSKGIAKRIVSEIYCDSLQIHNSQTIHIQDSIIRVQKEQNKLLRNVIDNDNYQITNLTLINGTLTNQILSCEHEIKKQKKQKKIFLVGMILCGVSAIVL